MVNYVFLKIMNQSRQDWCHSSFSCLNPQFGWWAERAIVAPPIGRGLNYSEAIWSNPRAKPDSDKFSDDAGD